MAGWGSSDADLLRWHHKGTLWEQLNFRSQFSISTGTAMKAKLENSVNFLSVKPVIIQAFICIFLRQRLAFSSTQLMGNLNIDYFVCSSAFTVCASDSQEDNHRLYLQIISFLKNLFFASTQPSQVGFCLKQALLGPFFMLWKKYKLCHKDIETVGKSWKWLMHSVDKSL